MTFELYDTFRQAIVPFEPGPHVRMYTCGITPYDATHLGHAATFIAYDVLQRHLWPDAERTARAMSAHVFRVRVRIEPIGLTVYTIRGRGVVLDHDDRPTQVPRRPAS